jgi:hypothetical protein
MQQPSVDFQKTCKEYKIGLQIESTQQAIQTYGVLLEDKRNFAALLIPASNKAISDDEKVKLQKFKMNFKAITT